MSSILSDIGSGIIPFTLLLGVLVFVHELGHFLVAKANGVRVEVFSLGFGKKILSYKKGHTTYCISLIPLGGYVKMFGEQSGDHIAESDKSESFTHKKVWQRISIVLAGPLMNFFFAILVFGFVSYKGEETRSARIAEVQTGSEAEKSGLKSQDLVLSVAGQSVRSYEELQKQLNANEEKIVELEVQGTDDNQIRKVSVAVKSIANPNIFSLDKTVGQVDGLLPYSKGTLVAVKADSAAAKIGFKTGDEILKINSKKVQSWSELNKLLTATETEVVVERNSENIDVKADVNDTQKQQLTLKIKSAEITSGLQNIEQFGLENPELYLEQIVPGSPAEAAGLMKYDKIIAINSKPITAWENVLTTIKSYDGKEALMFTVLREGTELLKKITPHMTTQMTFQGKEEKRFTIGILPMANIAQPELVIVKENSVFSAFAKGFDRSWDISVMTVMSFVKLFQGEVSHKNIGGMLSIGKAAKDSYAMGLQSFLMTMGILSISLFILNLLPIPVLDGGHLVFYTIELIKGSPLSVKKMEIAHQIGFALLMGLMVLALFNDFTKFLFKA